MITTKENKQTDKKTNKQINKLRNQITEPDYATSKHVYVQF